MISRTGRRPCANKPAAIDPAALTGKRVVIMGLGSFGGGAAAARFFARRGARVLVTDLRPADKLADGIAELQHHPVKYALGGHREEDFRAADIVVVNPAVKQDSPLVRAARDAGAVCTTEMNLFLQLCPLPVLAVTGSNGKSTTTALAADILGRACPVWLGGNIGAPLLDHDDIRTADAGWVVLEQSSFQLLAADTTGYAPAAAVLTNLTSNHLDWHPDYSHYIYSKQAITRHQQADDLLVLNADDPDSRRWATETRARVQWVSTRGPVERGAWMKDNTLWLRLEDGPPVELCPRSALRLPGDFNVSNFLQASLAALHAGAKPEHCVESARAFQGLEHRLELFTTKQDVHFYNDSIATTPESAARAVEAVTRPMILLLGGYDKGTPFDELARAVAAAAHMKHVVLLGVCAQRIGDALREADAACTIEYASDFTDAVRRACAAAAPGDAVVLSPACASYDMFNNFRERAAEFKRLVGEWQP